MLMNQVLGGKYKKTVPRMQELSSDWYRDLHFWWWLQIADRVFVIPKYTHTQTHRQTDTQTHTHTCTHTHAHLVTLVTTAMHSILRSIC